MRSDPPAMSDRPGSFTDTGVDPDEKRESILPSPTSPERVKNLESTLIMTYSAMCALQGYIEGVMLMQDKEWQPPMDVQSAHEMFVEVMYVEE